MDNFKFKIIVTEIKNSVDGFKNILDTPEERISDLKDRSVENTQIKTQSGKKNAKIKFHKRRIGQCKGLGLVIGHQKEIREKIETEAVFEEILIKNFAKLMNNIKPEI